MTAKQETSKVAFGEVDEVVGGLVWCEVGDEVAGGELVAMRVHVLTDGVGDVTGDEGESVEGASGDVRGVAEDAGFSEGFYRWLQGVELRVREVVEVDEDYVFLAVAGLAYAFYCFHARTVERAVLALARKEGVSVNGELDNEGSGGEGADKIHCCHVFVAVCKQLGELRRVCKREPKDDPRYADDGCELFVGEQAKNDNSNKKTTMKKETQKYKAAMVIFPVEMLRKLKELSSANNRSLAGQVRAMLSERMGDKGTV